MSRAAVEKLHSLDGPDPLATLLSEQTTGIGKVDDASVNWSESIYLSHTRGTSFKRGIMVFLAKHAGTYTGMQRMVQPTEHPMNLHPNTKPIHRQPHRPSPESGGVLEQHVETQLAAVFIEPVQTE